MTIPNLASRKSRFEGAQWRYSPADRRVVAWQTGRLLAIHPAPWALEGVCAPQFVLWRSQDVPDQTRDGDVAEVLSAAGYGYYGLGLVFGSRVIFGA